MANFKQISIISTDPIQSPKEEPCRPTDHPKISVKYFTNMPVLFDCCLVHQNNINNYYFFKSKQATGPDNTMRILQ